MKKSVLALVFIGAMLASLGSIRAESAADIKKVKVVTTTTTLASIAHEVGGDLVDVTSLARGTENPHFVEAKPSFIKRLSKAEVYVKLPAASMAG